MRVVSGSARGRRLRTPDGTDVRPTSDRVREATFNALGSMGGLHDMTVLDLFAGSGAMGIEALSRGAGPVTFVDQSARALEAIRDNLRTTGLSDRAQVVRSEAAAFLARAGRFDLVVLDPPYSFDDWDTLLGSVDADLVVIEADRVIAVPDTMVVTRERRYGGTVVLIARSKDREDHGRPISEDRT